MSPEWAALGLDLPAWVPSPLEAAGSVTGAVCVWLVVRRHVLNFPVGIVSCGCFLVLFWQQALYGDAGLQVVFIALGFHGWYVWLRGGPGHGRRPVGRVPGWEAAALGAALVGGTYGLYAFLVWVRGSAPFLDALTTALSLVAQWMLNRKYVENWLVWITADVLYVYLYLSRDLYLTAGLYVLFLGMCVAGLVQWRRELRAS